MRALAIVVVLVVAGLSASVACAQMSSSIPPGAVASNVRVVGYSEVDMAAGLWRRPTIVTGPHHESRNDQ